MEHLLTKDNSTEQQKDFAFPRVEFSEKDWRLQGGNTKLPSEITATNLPSLDFKISDCIEAPQQRVPDYLPSLSSAIASIPMTWQAFSGYPYITDSASGRSIPNMQQLKIGKMVALPVATLGLVNLESDLSKMIDPTRTTGNRILYGLASAADGFLVAVSAQQFTSRNPLLIAMAAGLTYRTLLGVAEAAGFAAKKYF